MDQESMEADFEEKNSGVIVTELDLTTFTFDSLINDIIEHKIFKYFWFNHWVTTFALVSKRWKRICENSKVAPKHLFLNAQSQLNVADALMIVKKSQPTVLELKGQYLPGQKFAFDRLIRSSTSLNTLILHGTSYMDDIKDLLDNITTLVLAYTHSEDVPETLKSDLFPNLK